MSVIAFVEQRDGILRKVAFETITAGRAVADAFGAELTAALVGTAAAGEAEKLGQHGADRVLVAAADSLAEYNPEGYTAALAQAVNGRSVKAVLFSATALGKDLAPRVAARLRAGLASDVTEVTVEDGRLFAVRPAYGGKVFLKLAFSTEPALLSLRPRAFTPAENRREAKVEELALDLDPSSWRTQVRRLDEGDKKERPDVAEAEIIVSGGRGMQGPENWHLLEQLADALGPGTGLGASRAVVDSGWRPHSEQVGQTGKVVAPPLYFAIGISGAIQHQAGMRTAKCIVAVNKDAEAPIFKLADYGIVGDLFEVVPRLTEEIRKLRSEE